MINSDDLKKTDEGKIFAILLRNLLKVYDCPPHDLIIAKINAWVASLDSSRLINHLSNRKKIIIIGEKVYSVYQRAIICDLFSVLRYIEFASYAENKTPLLLDEIYCEW